jgi:hypothetical protein
MLEWSAAVERVKRFLTSLLRAHICSEQLGIWTFGPFFAEFSNDINETICSNWFGLMLTLGKPGKRVQFCHNSAESPTVQLDNIISSRL